jgi:hypothetical protein
MHGNPSLVCPLPSGLTKLTNLMDLCLVDSVPSKSLEVKKKHNAEQESLGENTILGRSLAVKNGGEGYSVL